MLYLISSCATLGVINERVNEPDFALAQYSQLRDYLKTHLEKIEIRVALLAIARDVVVFIPTEDQPGIAKRCGKSLTEYFGGRRLITLSIINHRW